METFSFLFGGVGVTLLSMLLTFWWEWRKRTREVQYLTAALQAELEENVCDLRFEGINDWGTVIIFPPLSDVALRGLLAHPDATQGSPGRIIREAAIEAHRAIRDAEAYVVARNAIATSVPTSKREEFNRSTSEFLRQLVNPRLETLSVVLDRKRIAGSAEGLGGA
jgi:hypothetical protein